MPQHRRSAFLISLVLVISLLGLPTQAAVDEGESSASESYASENHVAVAVAPVLVDTPRLSGSNRYGTAVATSRHLYPDGTRTVFVASGTTFPDALTGGSLAHRLGGPILLVRPDSIPPAVADELRRLRPTTIYVLGGTGAVNEPAVRELQGLAPTVARISGDDRYATAVQIARLGWESSGTVYLAAGGSFPDALAGGAAAAYQGVPVLLSRPAGLSSATVAELRRLGPSQVAVLGGTGVLSDAVVQQVRAELPSAHVVRHSGSDRYATSAAVARAVWGQGSATALYATGADFPDALSGIPAAARHQAPLMLVRQNCTPSTTAESAAALRVRTARLLGGTGVLSAGSPYQVCGAPRTVVSALLDDIPVKGRAPRTGYDRALFGPAWTDNHDAPGGRNGCDTRNDVLRRDLTSTRLAPNGCRSSTAG
ncbi:cell wall-binding repeat-containing protein [Ornithinimicrobium sp. Y1694]|uniref:cell wall-binding repeat-containing protein n=1 Tax=Ornithinimicrobium sp. Y1694 TaxID=3418590 RepID=UPI003CE93212